MISGQIRKSIWLGALFQIFPLILTKDLVYTSDRAYHEDIRERIFFFTNNGIT